MKNIILIGGGGHCRACIDVIEAEGKYKIAGILDQKEKIGQKVLGYAIIGTDNDLPKLKKKFKYFLITIGQIKIFQNRVNVYAKLREHGVVLPTIISPNAHVSRHAQVGEGTIVMHNAVVNAGAKVGRNCIVNTGAIIEHDAMIGDHVHVSTGSVINGGAEVGHKTFIGSKSVIRENVHIIQETVIGAGSVVTSNIFEIGIYAGQPAKSLPAGREGSIKNA